MGSGVGIVCPVVWAEAAAGATATAAIARRMMLKRRMGGTLAPQKSDRWDRGVDCRPAANRALEVQVPAKRLHPIGQPAQPGTGARGGAADPVIGHLDERGAVRARDPDGDLA